MTNAAVIFDMDGVVVDSHPAHLAAWQDVLAKENRRVSVEDLSVIFEGRRRDEILFRFFGQLSTAEADRLGRMKDQLFWARRDLLKLTPGFLDFLHDLESNGVRTAVATSASRDRATKTLDHFHLSSRFGTVVTGDDVAAGKPDPALFIAAADRLGVPAWRSMVIEDAVAGIRAAKSAGMACIAILSRPELRVQLLQECPDELRNNLDGMRFHCVEQVFRHHHESHRPVR